MNHIVLASQSPQRKDILQTLRQPFIVAPSFIDEAAITANTHLERARLVAQAKATKVQIDYPESIIIAGDTYVLNGDQALEKPTSLQQATEMLTQLSGKTCLAITGVCYLDPAINFKHVQTVTTQFVFRELSNSEIAQYVANEPVLTWSAGFCPAYPTGAALVARIEGSFTSFTHGLPLEVITACLRKSGIQV
jgi:MAF protein